MYSATSETTRDVCTQIGFLASVGFVETMKMNGKIYVRGTCGKPHEFRALQDACERYGFIYKGGRC